jgi:hypothetical protein
MSTSDDSMVPSALREYAKSRRWEYGYRTGCYWLNDRQPEDKTKCYFRASQYSEGEDILEFDLIRGEIIACDGRYF